MSMIPEEPRHNPRATIGDNQPPGPVDTLIAAQREALTKEKRERLQYIVEKADAKHVTDRETAGQAGDILRVAREFEKLVEGDRVERTKPYRDAADAAKAVCDEFLDPLRMAMDRLDQRLQEWDAENDKLIAAQQREQEAFFKSALEPVRSIQTRTKRDYSPPSGERTEAVPQDIPVDNPNPVLPAKRRKIVGDLGARVSRVEQKVYTVVDIHKVPDFILNTATVHAAVAQVAKAMGKHMQEIPGIDISTANTTRIS